MPPWPVRKRIAIVGAAACALLSLPLVAWLGERYEIGFLNSWALLHGSVFIVLPLAYAAFYLLLRVVLK